jgi:hypothetical protein
MGKIFLTKQVDFAGKQFVYDSAQTVLDPEIDRQSQCVAFYPTNFVPVGFFKGQNFGHPGLIITVASFIRDLSKTPWGNWANCIRSIAFGQHVANLLEKAALDPALIRDLAIVRGGEPGVSPIAATWAGEGLPEIAGDPTPEERAQVQELFARRGNPEDRITRDQIPIPVRKVLDAIASRFAGRLGCEVEAVYGCGSCCGSDLKGNHVKTTCGWQCWHCANDPCD